MGKWKELNLRELSRWSSFGRELGVSSRPWIERYGSRWQTHLAKAVSGGKPVYNGLAVPTTLRKSDAELYLRNSSRIFSRAVSDRSPGSPRTIEQHYAEIARRQNERFIRSITEGARLDKRKSVDLLERHVRKLKRLNPNYIPNQRIKRLLDHEKKGRDKRIRHREKPINPKAKDTAKFMRSMTKGELTDKAKLNVHLKVQKKIDLINASHNGRDLGVAIGSGVDEDAEYNKLIELLKSGMFISRKAFMGIVRSRKASERIIRSLGLKYYNDNFRDRMHEVQHSGSKWVEFKYEGGYRPKYYKRGSVGESLRKGIEGTRKDFYKKVKDDLKKP